MDALSRLLSSSSLVCRGVVLLFLAIYLLPVSLRLADDGMTMDGTAVWRHDSVPPHNEPRQERQLTAAAPPVPGGLPGVGFGHGSVLGYRHCRRDWLLDCQL